MPFLTRLLEKCRFIPRSRLRRSERNGLVNFAMKPFAVVVRSDESIEWHEPVAWSRRISCVARCRPAGVSISKEAENVHAHRPLARAKAEGSALARSCLSGLTRPRRTRRQCRSCLCLPAVAHGHQGGA